MKFILLFAVSMAGCAPLPPPPTPPRPGTAAVPTPEQEIMAAEMSWHSCLLGAASHFGARAGRAGPGAPPQPDPFVECKRDGDHLEQLLAAWPVQPHPGGTFDERWRRIQEAVGNAFQAAYQANNHE